MKPGLEISAKEAKQLLDASGLVLIDCRTQPEWDLVHIGGTVHIPLDEIEQRADEVETDKPVAVICHHGVRSLRAALALRALGHPGALSVAGGIEEWSRSADPSVRRYERQGGVCRLL